MPKIKTNRTAHKKFRFNAKGKLKRAQAFKSHNTAKKSPKRLRTLRGFIAVSMEDVKAIRNMLPYLRKYS